MKKSLKTATLMLALGGVLASCGYVSEYEDRVYDMSPVYCYKSLAAVQCFEEPRFADEKRLVNYYGPHPSRYNRPDEPDIPELQAPKSIDYWVKDEEPRPLAAPVKVRTIARQASPEAEPATDASADLSIMDRLRRSVFGKPELANSPG